MRHGKESEGIEVEIAIQDNMSIRKTTENYIVGENSDNWNENKLGDTTDSDTDVNMVQVKNLELSSEVEEERWEEHDDDK